LTLSSIWKANADDYDHECLLQISEIDGRQIKTTQSCPIGKYHEPMTMVRRICWTDVMDSYLYITEVAKTYPETLVGALKFNLSVASFAALKTEGKVRHRYIQIDDQNLAFSENDLEGTLVSDGPATFKLIINDMVVEVPTIEANYVNFKTNDTIRVKVLDDARFPLMLDYYIPSFHRFFITYNKVSFPTVNQVEQHLAVDKHTDVYGIYFNFASDELRSESEPVLHEIADALKAHPDWTLIINGHTDNVGGDALNLDLSRRRATAVRKALVERYKIGDSRLTTNGFGASQPKESNDSDRGRALNRRVELVRP
jgi:flagellar motor protein MotB